MPQRMLSDNGMALNPSRRGVTGQLVAHVTRLGVQAITGKPYKPTTQGNTERPHQGPPGRVTPLTAWQGTPKAEAPRPQPTSVHGVTAAPAARTATTATRDAARVMRLRKDGAVRLRGVTYMVDGQRAGQDVLIVEDGNKILIADLQGTILIEHARPAPGIKYVGNGRPRGRRPRTAPTATEVLTHEPSPKS